MKIPFFTRRIPFVLAILGTMATPAVGQHSKTLHRQLDPVVAKGEIVRPFWGRDISRLRLFAYKDSRWQRIPYQIDKVDADGNYFIALNSVPDQVREEVGFDEISEEKKRDSRIAKFADARVQLLDKVNRKELSQEEFEELKRAAYFVEELSALDYNDELVFMARDSGDRATKGAWLAKEAIEIELFDPVDGSRAWVYLFYFAENPPPRSKLDYINYKPEEDTIVSQRLEIDFNNDKPMIIERLVGTPPGGQPLPDVLDRFKLHIRVKPRILFCLSIDFDENNTKAFTAGYKDGPVRVIRRSVFWIMIGGVKLPFAPKMISYLTAYEYGLSSKAEYHIPVDLSWFLCKGSSFKAGLDLLETTYGANVFSNDNPIGTMVIDGTISKEEQGVMKKDQHWVAGYLPNRAALISRLLHDQRLVEQGVTLDLAYEDDATLPGDGTENEPGQHFVGHTLDLNRIPEGTYEFGFQIYAVYGFEPDDVQQLLNIDDHALEIRGSTP